MNALHSNYSSGLFYLELTDSTNGLQKVYKNILCPFCDASTDGLGATYHESNCKYITRLADDIKSRKK